MQGIFMDDEKCTKVRRAVSLPSGKFQSRCRGEVNHKDYGATHLGGNLSNLISLVPDFSNCKMNNT